MMFDLTHVSTINEAKHFIDWCLKELGLGFHPDTPFTEYNNRETRERTYTPETCERLDTLLNECFQLFKECNEDIYSYCLDNCEEYQKLIKQ